MREALATSTSAFVLRHLRAIGYTAFGAAVFVASLAATFPYAATLSALLRPLSLSLSSAGQGFTLPLGAALSNVRLVSLESSRPFEIESPNVTLTPALGAMLLGEPGVRIHARLYGGTLTATVYRNGSAIGVNFRVSDIGLSRLESLPTLGAKVVGRLSGRGSAQMQNNDPAASNGRLNFHARGLTIRVMEGIAPVRLGDVEGSLTFDHGALKLTSLRGHGADGRIAALGAVNLGSGRRAGRVNLRLTLEPSAAGRKRLGLLLGMLPHPPGPHPYVITGPLFAPSFS